MNIKRKDNNLVLFKDLVGGDGALKCLAKIDLVEPIKGSFVEE